MNGRIAILAVLNAAVLACGLFADRPSVPGDADYPVRPIELVVPFSHGGGTDTFARIMEFAIRENGLLAQPVTVMNRGGAGATIGSRYVKDAEPDGYTLLVLHDALITAKHSGMVDFGPEAFEAIAGTGELGMVIAVAESSEYTTLDDLLSAAAAEPETIRFGANLGALTHFAGMQLEKAAPGARFLFPQVGGGADRFGDLIGGHIDVTGFSIEEFHRFSSGGVRGLAYLGPARHPAVPDLPTARELGYDVINTNMFFWWFPKGTPTEPIRVMREALRQAMDSEFVRQKLAEIQCEPVFLTGDELQARVSEADERFARVVTRPQTVLLDLPWILVSGCVMLLVIIALERWGRSISGAASEDEDEDSEDEPSAGEQRRAVYCLALTAAYTIALASGVGFSLCTIVFVPAVGTLLIPEARAGQILTLLLIGQGLGFGLDALFIRLLDVNLP